MMLPHVMHWLAQIPAANANWLDRLLGLSRLSMDQGNLELGWNHHLPAYAWVGIGIAAWLIAWFSYRNLAAPRRWRLLLAAGRTALLLLIVALLAEPLAVLRRENIEPDTLLILVDRSLSMTVQDHPAPAPAPGSDPEGERRESDPRRDAAPARADADDNEVDRVQAKAPASGLISRDQAVRGAIARAEPAMQYDPEVRRIVWLGFDANVFELPGASGRSNASGASRISGISGASGSGDSRDDDDDPAGRFRQSAIAPPWAAPRGRRTDLDAAITQAITRMGQGPISAVAVISDGRSTQTSDASALEALRQRGIPVLAVPVGASEASLDFAIDQVDAPQRALVRDRVPVIVRLTQLAGTAEAPAGGLLNVTLADAVTGQELDQMQVDASRWAEPITLSAQVDQPGTMTWQVKAAYQPAAGQTPERVTANNAAQVTVRMVDRAVRVLYVEGYPRWEYRYLTNLLRREESIQSSVLLISAAGQYVQEGDVSMSRLPLDAGELEPFDVVIIGDVPAGYFGQAWLKLLRDHVSLRGAGLMWIGGSTHTPGSYLRSPAEALLPMRSPDRVDRWMSAAGGAMIMPTEQARRMGVLDLSQFAQASDFARAAGAADANVPAQPDAAAVEPGPQGPSLMQATRARWRRLQPVTWVQAITPLRRAVEVLATAVPGQATAPADPPNAPAQPLNPPSNAGDAQPDVPSDAPPDHAASRHLADRSTPVLTRHRFGSGQVLYLATDETWRWRRGVGDRYVQPFWIQLVQMLARHRLEQQRGVRIETANAQVQTDQPLPVTVTIEDALLLQRDLPKLDVAVYRADDPTGEPETTLTLTPQQGPTPAPGSPVPAPGSSVPGSPVPASPASENSTSRSSAPGPPGPPGAPGSPGVGTRQNQANGTSTTAPRAEAVMQPSTSNLTRQRFTAQWRPRHPGQWVLQVREPALAQVDASVQVTVFDAGSELQRPETDHARLEQLAQRSMGQVVPLRELATLPEKAPNRARRTPNDVSESLRHAPLLLALFMILITAEWVGRKLLRLV